MYQVATERIRRPGVAHLARFGARDRLAAEVVDADALDQADVVERQHVRAKEVEDEEHLGGPAADAADADQLLDDRLVVHLAPACRPDRARLEVLGEVAQVLDLARRQAGGADVRRVEREHGVRREPAATGRR